MSDSDARYRSLFDTTPDLVLIMDERGIVVAANASVERILGFATEDLIGSPLSRLMPERYRHRHAEGLRRYLATGERRLDWRSIQLPALAADGREIPLSIAFGEFDEGGKRFFTGILRDVTAERRAAEELEAQSEELRKVARVLSQKTAEADQANKAKSEFLASMSHELRTPLNAIGGYVELLEMGLRGSLTDQQQADLKRIRINQNHLLALINDVLNFAKVDAGRLEYRIETVALDQVLKVCESMVLPQIHARRISYSYKECGEPVFVRADQDKVQQILLNLLGNAIKFTPEGGSLIASCDQTETIGRVRVRDTGIGIEADKLEAIFEPFVQVNRALNEPGQGAGLGLAISRSLARAMGGDIVVESEPGVGSTFFLTLPRPHDSHSYPASVHSQ